MDDLVLPVKRGALIGRAVGCVVFMVLGAALPLLALAEPGALPLCLVGSGLVIAVFGLNLMWYVRVLKSPGLRLDRRGVEIVGHTWAWSDIRGFKAARAGEDEGAITYVKVLYGPQANVTGDVKASAALGKLFLRGPPVYIPEVFDTEGESLESILRDWRERNS